MELLDGEVALRRWTLDDVSAVTAACQDPEIQHWIPLIPRPYTEEHAREFLQREGDSWDAGTSYNFAVTVVGRVVGSMAVRVNQFKTGHIGYWTERGERGRGVTTRALRLACRWSFEQLELGRLELVTDPDNVASQRVAEKVGFIREGVLRAHVLHPDGRRRDSVMFSLLPGELR